MIPISPFAGHWELTSQKNNKFTTLEGGYIIKVKVEFECDVDITRFTPWFTVNDELQHTNLEDIDNLKVFDVESGKEI